MCWKSGCPPDLFDSDASAGTSYGKLDVDRVFECLANPRRRAILGLLAVEPECTVERIVDHLATDETAPGGGAERAIETVLYHRHFPKLRAAGLIATADDHRFVRRGENYPLVGELLEVAISEFA